MPTLNASNISAPDLTKLPPRSPRSLLGGYVLLPRMLDKGGAQIVGTAGEYHYNCPLDQHLISFIGFDPDALREQLITGKGDGEILDWLNANAVHKRTRWDIEQWSEFQCRRGPDSDAETLAFFAEKVGGLTKARKDIRTWIDMLELDDYVSFGGKP